MIGIINSQDTGNEAEAIRQVVEYFGCQTILYKVGRPMDFINVLNGNNRLENIRFLVICGHGVNQRFVMPQLAEDVYIENEPKTDIGIELLEEHAQFQNQIIMTTGCNLAELGTIILQKGADAYIAPTDYIDGNAGLQFVVRFFYELLQNQRSIRQAFQLAKTIDKETGLFKLYNKQNK